MVADRLIHANTPEHPDAGHPADALLRLADHLQALLQIMPRILIGMAELAAVAPAREKLLAVIESCFARKP